MNVNGKPFRSIWPLDDAAVGIIDQRRLPYEFATLELNTCAAVVDAIKTMQVRGAPLIGVTAAYGLALALRADAGDAQLVDAVDLLAAARPTAVNLRWALERMQCQLAPLAVGVRAAAAWQMARVIAEEDVAINRALGAHGAALIGAIHRRTGGRVEILTHCNTGWIAAVDFGTALSAVYQAHDAGVPVHIWVDETRPRNQGLLTAWELAAHGVPHTVIVDNAGGHLMRAGRVDLVLVGADRVAANGDVCNKIGTYLKALAAHDCGVPFYAAVPTPTIDWAAASGAAVPIEERDGDEVRSVRGRAPDGTVMAVAITDAATAVANPAFDVTPARLVTGIITEHGIAAPAGALRLWYDRVAAERGPV